MTIFLIYFIFSGLILGLITGLYWILKTIKLI